MRAAVGVFLVFSLAVAATGYPLQEVDDEASEVRERSLRSSQFENFLKRFSPDLDGIAENQSKKQLGIKGSRVPGKDSYRPKYGDFVIGDVVGNGNIINICAAVKCKFLQRRNEVNVQSDVGATGPQRDFDNVELFESKSQADFRRLYKEKVVKAALYRIPPSVLGKDATDNEEQLDGVLVTLLKGRKLMITHGPELWGDEQSAILEVEDLTDNWEFVGSKNVQFSIVADYVSTSDSSSNTKEAAVKMMALD